jgi:hypothetical protein
MRLCSGVVRFRYGEEGHSVVAAMCFGAKWAGVAFLCLRRGGGAFSRKVVERLMPEAPMGRVKERWESGISGTNFVHGHSAPKCSS